MSQRTEHVFPPTSSFLSIKVKDFDIDKCAPTKVFVIANVTVMRSTKHFAVGGCLGLRETSMAELSVDNTHCNKM